MVPAARASSSGGTPRPRSIAARRPGRPHAAPRPCSSRPGPGPGPGPALGPARLSPTQPSAMAPLPRGTLVGGAALLLLLLPAVAAGTACSQYTNKTCRECLSNASCLWCNTNNTCSDYPVTRILPPASLCQLSSARWGVCWVNFEALIIAMSVVGGSILLGVCYCCCCCCRRRRRSREPDKQEEKAIREREERRIRQEERRAEMKSRHDEIRKKYGLFKEENAYARFENH